MGAIQEDLDTRSRELAEAFDQQAATAEILRVISRSPADLQPVFDTILANALRLCEANWAFVVRHQDGWLSLAARTDCTREFAEYLAAGFPVDRETTAGRAALERKPVQVLDFMAEPGMRVTPAHRSESVRTVLAVPLLREDRLLGVIALRRREVRAFSEKQIALLQTFADQAVIAIENVRLFNELEARNRALTEALEQQTATSEILRVISESPTDVQPVFDTIAGAAVKLCEAGGSNVFTFDGRLLHLAAIHAVKSEHAEFIRKAFPRPPDDRGFGVSRAVMTRKVVVIPDVRADPDYADRDFGLWGFRSVLSVPLMRDGVPIGAIGVGRPEPGPFPQNQITLLQTFADQAVIAIENVRLFKELDARNRELSEALEQQTATSEILRVLSRSPTDAQPVFDAIAAAALKLCDANSANVFTFDGALLHLVAIAGTSPEGMEAIRRLWPRPLDRGTAASRAVLSRSVAAIHDTHLDPDFALKSLARWGFRSILGIPLMREDKSDGRHRCRPARRGPVSGKTDRFAADLCRSGGDRDRERSALQGTRGADDRAHAVGRRTAGTGRGRPGRQFDARPGNRTEHDRRARHQLAGMDGGSIYEYEEVREEFRLHTAHRLPDELIEALRSRPVPKGEGAVGQLAVTGQPVAIREIKDEGIYQSQVREILLRHGYRSLLAVPLLRENRLLGGLVVNRKSAGEFAPRVIDLLKTFATQSALAIQNARLFREIEDKSRQLEIASRQKSAFLANMSHELRTPLNAIIGFTRIVMRRSQEQLEPKQFENLEKILTSGQQLLALINTILDLAKVEAGRVDVNPAEIQPALLLEQCMRTVEPLIKEPVTLVKGFDGELPLMLVDEEMLRQIILNLLSNAAKFTARGNIHVRARADDGTVQIAVADTGIGIAADKLESIFEEFEQADASSTRVHGGTGLGLTIARRLARLMGGDVCVESVPSVGSTFTLTLPVRYQSPRT